MIKFDRFKDGKKHILTMSYDDGRKADKRLAEIFDKHGIKGTFHINSGRLGGVNLEEGEVAETYKNHEISVHSESHPFLERIATQNAVLEIINDRKKLEELCGYPVRGMSFPFGTYDDNVLQIIKQCGIVYSRTTKSTNWFGFPTNFLEWHPTCHHNADIMGLAKTFTDRIESQVHSMLFYLWGHSFEFDNDNNWHVIEEFCEFMGGRDEIWYATNIEIYDYITAQRNLQISVDNKIIYNPSFAPVWVSYNNETVKINGGETIKF